MKQLAASLVKAQKQFAPALKTSTNPHFKSKYADLSACVEAVVDALNDNGIYLSQQCHENESGVVVETVFIHESGETLSCGKLHVPAVKQDPQGYGSALTYARRYSLMAACGIAPEDDDGNAASKTVRIGTNFKDHATSKGTITPGTGVFESLDMEEQKYLREVALHVIGLLDNSNPKGAVRHIQSLKLDADERVALNTLFDSKQRAAMKLANEEMKEAA